MEYKFYWQSNVSDEAKSSAEETIRNFQESGHSSVKFCHNGTVTVTLSSPDPLQTTLVGNMKCDCGKPRGIISGKSDGSSISLEPVNS